MEDFDNIDVVYVKLTNGEELFAMNHGEQDGKLLLEEVLILETIHSDETLKYQFMSRYAPYGELPSMRIDMSNVIFVLPASEHVKMHYVASLNYARKISDERFQEGIADATNFLKKVMAKDEKKRQAAAATVDNFLENFLSRYEPDSNTKH